MDRRTLAAIAVSLVIYTGWLAIRGPTPKPGEEPVPEPGPESGGAAPAEAPDPSVVEVASEAPVELVPLEACGASFSVSTEGGAIRGVVLPGVAGPYEVTPIYSWVLGFFTGSSSVPWLPYGPEPGPAHLLSEGSRAVEVAVGGVVPRLSVESRSAEGVVLTGRARGGVQVRHEVRRAEGEACTLAVTTTYTNPTDAELPVKASWAIRDHTGKDGGRSRGQHQPTALVDGSLYYGGALGAGCVRSGTKLVDDSEPIPLPGELSWFGVSDRYFGFYVVPETNVGELRFERLGKGDESLDGGVTEAVLDLPAGGSVEWKGRVYAGENNVEALAAVHPTLDRVVDLGWFAMFGKPLLWVLSLLHQALGQWGLAIIGVTVLLKMLFFPLTWRAMKSGQAMQAIQPKLAEIRTLYANDPQEQNRRTMELMSQSGVNPLSGCWPMFVQMPVFVALYNVLLTNVEFYQEPFAYLRDLSSPDPYCLLPIAVTALMGFQQRLTPTPENMDPAQQAVLKWMPLMFGLFFFTSPSGLAVYVFVNVLLSIAQQWLIKRSLGMATPPAAMGVM